MTQESETPPIERRAAERTVDRSAFLPSQESSYLRIFQSNIYVRDHDRSLKFYIGKLGFSVVAEARFEFGRWVAVAPPDGSAILALLAPIPGSQNYKLIGRHTQIGFIAEDIYSTFELWRSRGVRFLRPPQPQLWGGAFATFSDEDGNTFELIGSDEMSREIEAQRRAGAEKLQAERRAAQDLEIAKMVQARLFPQMLPEFPTLDYAGVCTQALSVGGDYYDFLDLGQDRLGLVVGDISGKGIAAALLMANLQANLRSRTALAVESPEQFLASVNRLFHENSTDNAFATLFFAEYDSRCQCMRYANCGHLPAILLRADGTLEMLNPTAAVLGVFADWTCTIEHCALHPGDVLALYTDGVTEAFNRDEEEFGEARLVEALRRHRHEPAASMVASIVEQVRNFGTGGQHDDITLIVAKCCAKA